MSKDLTEALDALMRQQRQQRPKPPTPRGSAAPQISSGVPGSSEASSGSGDGVASPLIEHDAAAREYYQEGWKTTDGLFTLPAIKRAFFIDANGRSVEFHFGAPK